MNGMKRLWLLGAPDPEMAAIDALLRECGERVAYAQDERGERVRTTNAYDGWEMPEAWGSEVYLIECDPRRGAGLDPVIRVIDHHRPGDPGYGRPSSEFLPASSLGQVISALARLKVLPLDEDGGGGFMPTRIEDDAVVPDGVIQYAVEDLDYQFPDEESAEDESLLRREWVVSIDQYGYAWALIPRGLVLTAAADHCLGAAYRGECPGVDPDALMRWRAESRARFQGRDVADVLADIERARNAAEAAAQIVLSDYGCAEHGGHHSDPETCQDCADARDTARDMRGTHVPELVEAGTRYGIAYVADGLTDSSGRRKIVCSGPPDVVRAFLAHWAPSQGLVDCYGDPARGFAGGYVE